MNTINRVFRWADVHHPKWIDYGRIVLGIIIFYKGVEFALEPQFLRQATADWDLSLWSLFFVHYIPMIHLMGGLLIAIGLITRIAVILQLPILIGAVILSGMSAGLFDLYSQFGLALFVLILLCIYLVYGSGEFSVDAYMKRHPDD